jgi:hypothetical protein
MDDRFETKIDIDNISEDDNEMSDIMLYNLKDENIDIPGKIYGKQNYKKTTYKQVEKDIYESPSFNTIYNENQKLTPLIDPTGSPTFVELKASGA